MSSADLKRSSNPLHSLYGRMALLLFAVVGLLMVGFGVALYALTRTHMDEVEQRLNSGLAAHLIEETPLLTETGVDDEALHHVLHTLMAVNPRIEVYVLDLDAHILAFEAPEGKVKATRVELDPILRFLDAVDRSETEGSNVVFPIRGSDPRDSNRAATFSASRIAGVDGEPGGFLYVVLQGTKYREAVGGLWASYAVRLAACALAIALFAAFGTGLFLIRRVTGPVERLVQQSERFAESGFSESPEDPVENSPHPTDEIQRLERTFLVMSQKMTAQLEELEQLDHHRRELVANVSHDLRTPVAILRGYIETLQLKSESLSDQERDDILNIALKQSERLGRLVSDLFELAKLDAGLVGCERDLVSVAELVQDVAQKFELPAQKRSVNLNLELDPVAPRAWIDVGLIERAIENLLDNALRHTPAGGDVTVAVRSLNESVEVCVSDTGSGIAAADLPRIFDRFYRGKSDAADRRKNLGLGLAIASKALELHESRVAVRSDGATGAAFWFELERGVA